MDGVDEGDSAALTTHSIAGASDTGISAARFDARIGLTTNSGGGGNRQIRDRRHDETACQLPVWLCSQLAAGTRNAAVPLAVYSRPALVVASLGPIDVGTGRGEKAVDLAPGEVDKACGSQ